MELREGHVLTRVCLSTSEGPMWSLPMIYWISLYGDPRPWPPGHQTLDSPPFRFWPCPSSDIWRSALETYSNLFIRGSPMGVTSDYQSMYSRCKRVVRILSCLLFIATTYVSLQLLVQNQTKKWHFPLNFHNGIKWSGAFSKAFGSSEALILVLSKNAPLYDIISNTFQSKTLYIVLIFKWSCLDTNLWIYNLCICQKTCQQNTNFW